MSFWPSAVISVEFQIRIVTFLEQELILIQIKYSSLNHKFGCLVVNLISVLARTWWLEMWTESYETKSVPPSVILHITSFHRLFQFKTLLMPDSEPRSLEFWI